MGIRRGLLLFFLAALLLVPATLCAQYRRLTNLPALYLTTFDGGGIWSKTDYKYCRMRYVDEADVLSFYDSVSVRGRGNSTWGLAKKPYRFKFLNKEKFLGKGYANAKKWTLLANAGDKTMIRNALTSEMGLFCAALRGPSEPKSLPFNPAVRFVDFTLNGVYQGTYQISDQVEVRPHRVNITEQAVPLAPGDDISGGYLLETDGFMDGNSFRTAIYDAPVRIHYPDDEDIIARQTAYVKQHIARFESALSSSSFTDPETGYRAFVDTASLVDWYICTELTANIDGFYSTYFYKERGDDRLFFGPLWDYDIAYNNDSRYPSTLRLLMADEAYSGSKAWVQRMWQDPWFQRRVCDRFEELLAAGIEDFLLAKTDSLAALLSASQALNYQKWGIDVRMYHEIVLYNSYERYISDLKSFIRTRCAFLSEAFEGRRPPDPFVPEDCYYRILGSGPKIPVGLSGTGVVQLTPATTDESRFWELQPLPDGRFFLVNAATSLALTDPTVGETTPTTNVGTPLTVAAPDADDPRQQWEIVPQGREGRFNLLNVHTQHIANLSGGSYAEGTPLLSYTNDGRNATSSNRLFLLEPDRDRPLSIFSPRASESADYALAYDPFTRELHFGADDAAALGFTARVFDLSGRPVGSFRSDERFSMASMPAGVYVVVWQHGGRTHAVKFGR